MVKMSIEQKQKNKYILAYLKVETRSGTPYRQ